MSESTSPGPADVLVVDDEPRNIRLLEGYLRAEGYRVRSAPNGEEALRLAREHVPDVVLLDVMMPGMNGHEVCRTLKADPRLRLSQVALVTALDGTAHRVEGLDCGADDFVSKPVRREEFMAKLRSMVRMRCLVLELEQARATLAERNARLEELEALKETLAQTLVHDLKNPLAAVVGNLSLIERRADDDVRRLVKRCHASSQRMHRMILDLLDVASLEESRLKLEPQAIDAAEVAGAALDGIRAAASHREVAFELEVPGEPCAVHADGSVLRRVLDNLLANALEHSPAEGQVRLRVVRREEGIEFNVADQGPGIPEEQRERVFEKFARLELKKAGLSSNRGLGLTFCRLAVEAHGGTIWIEDAPAGGALFRLLLPAFEHDRGAPDLAA